MIKNIRVCFFKLGFTPCKTEQPLQGIELQENKAWKGPTVNRCLLILGLKPFISQVKERHSISGEFQSQAVQGKKLLT